MKQGAREYKPSSWIMDNPTVTLHEFCECVRNGEMRKRPIVRYDYLIIFLSRGTLFVLGDYEYSDARDRALLYKPTTQWWILRVSNGVIIAQNRAEEMEDFDDRDS